MLDALNRKTIYHYQAGRLTKTDHYMEGALYKTEQLFWEKNKDREEWKVTAKAIQDGQGQVIKCQTYTYDCNGNQTSETLYGRLSGNDTPLPVIDNQGIVLNNGVESYTKQRVFATTPPFILLSEKEDNGKIVKYYDPNTFQKIVEFTGTETSILQRRIFEYDSEKRLIAILVDDGVSQDIHDMQGVTERLRHTSPMESTIQEIGNSQKSPKNNTWISLPINL